MLGNGHHTDAPFKFGDAARVILTPKTAALAAGQRRLAEPVPARKRQTIPWSEFEPTLVRIRNETPHRTAHAALYAMGYGGSSSFADWQRTGVPVIALRAARDVLVECGIKPEVPVVRQFNQRELVDLLSAISRLPANDVARSAIIARLAKEIADAE